MTNENYATENNSAEATCCGICDCTTCSCGCKPGECSCQETGCGCSTSAA